MLAVGYKKVPRDGTGSSAGAGGQTQTCEPGIMQSFLGFHSPPPADSDKEACGAIYEYLHTVHILLKIVHRTRKSFERPVYSQSMQKYLISAIKVLSRGCHILSARTTFPSER